LCESANRGRAAQNFPCKAVLRKTLPRHFAHLSLIERLLSITFSNASSSTGSPQADERAMVAQFDRYPSRPRAKL
jgi:hypothetical protein